MLEAKRSLSRNTKHLLTSFSLLGLLVIVVGGCAEPPPPRTATSSPVPSVAFSPPATVPSGTIVRIDGSTSMVTINQNLKNGFEKQFPGTTVTSKASGSKKGLKALQAGSADVAAVSQPLTAEEQNQGLVAASIGTDAIAIVVGKINPFNGGLTSTQVADIFQGRLNNWSALGEQGTIRVINRSYGGGTQQTFRELALKGGDFGQTSNISSLVRDATTPLLQSLQTDGITYATYSQVANQQTARVVPIDGVSPELPNYPYRRQLYYVYRQPPSPAVQAFLGYATSPQGQQVATGN